MKKEILIITSSRADYSPLKSLISLFEKSKDFKTTLVVTGQHLHKSSGNTFKEIKKNHKILIKKLQLNYTNFKQKNISLYMSEIINKFSILLSNNKPDFIIVLGDRYEILSCVISSMQFMVPVVHIHGGEITTGSMDNLYRNLITKISHIHFVCHKDYKKRLIQMGENSKLVFNFGSPSLDFVKKDKNNFINKKLNNFVSKKKTFIVTYHPNTILPKETNSEITNLLKALNNFKNYNFIITYPNLDNSNHEIVKKITNHSKKQKNIMVIKSLGKQRYFQLLNKVSGLIGNSSSAILESSSFKIPCLNIGSRQNGRIKTRNIFDCNFKKNSIIRGINFINSKNFKKNLKNLKNPFYQKNTNIKIFNKIKKLNPNQVLNNNF